MRKYLFLIFGLVYLGIGTGRAQYKDLLNFNGTNGQYPLCNLTISGNKLFGITQNGGSKDSGCIFSINTNGSGYSDLLDFNGLNGAFPQGSLTLSGDTLYGMTTDGGAFGDGCIFAI